MTTRGKFRNMELDELLRWADDPIWNEKLSRSAYGFPVSGPVALEDAARLSYGIPRSDLYPVGPFLAAQSHESHIGPFRWAIDFLVPDGTPVIAARDGTIVELEESSDRWGNSPEYRDMLNYLTISHKNGEFSQYCHIGKNSASERGCKVGDWVEIGKEIASVGKTGWTDRDHLHFIVFEPDTTRRNPFGFKSVKIQFKEQS